MPPSSLDIPPTMQAAVLREPGAGLVVEELRTPRPKAGEVLLRVTACGLCHSDLHVIAGKIASDMARGRENEAASPAEVAASILEGVEQGEFMIYPDPQSRHVQDLAAAGGDTLLDYLGAKR